MLRVSSVVQLLAIVTFAIGIALPADLNTHDTWTFDDTGHYNLTLPNNRWALVHRTPGYNASQRHALVIAFHGAGSSAQTQESISNFSNESLKINDQDIVVVYGQGTESSRGFVWQGAPYSSSADDIAYTHDIISVVQSNLSIDSKRIYAVGMSNGGGFVNLLACTASTASIFGAFATSSPALYNGTRSMSGCDTGGVPIALMDFHGLADQTIPYKGQAGLDGDTAYALPDIDTWRQSWAERAECTIPPNARTPMAPSSAIPDYAGQNATCYRWNCSSATVIGYTVQTMGHIWLTKDDGYWDETPVNIVKFFDAHPLGQPTN